PAAFRNPEISKELFRCLPLGVTIITIPNLYEQVTIKIPVEHIEWEWFLSNLNEHSKRTYELSKRALDIIIALIGLSISIVVAPLVALAIKLTSPGPVIFKQVRTGQGGVPFVAMKFRSMRTDAEASGPQWAQKTDPRITPFGRFMRKTRLDEIPQLINVLRGELSIVGPRPERPEFIELLTKEIPFYQQRLLVKPGLTGWAQLNGPAYGGSVPESLEKVKYDLYYIKHRSLILDLTVILKTIKTVISAKGQ
ncbi:MAG: sugar transferase, partial [Candidatus Buchananbacteria bacterium]|nr:sugar transferase [Candidatus Buchananbacteria bacterium]